MLLSLLRCICRDAPHTPTALAWHAYTAGINPSQLHVYAETLVCLPRDSQLNRLREIRKVCDVASCGSCGGDATSYGVSAQCTATAQAVSQGEHVHESTKSTVMTWDATTAALP